MLNCNQQKCATYIEQRILISFILLFAERQTTQANSSGLDSDNDTTVAVFVINASEPEK